MPYRKLNLASVLVSRPYVENCPFFFNGKAMTFFGFIAASHPDPYVLDVKGGLVGSHGFVFAQ